MLRFSLVSPDAGKPPIDLCWHCCGGLAPAGVEFVLRGALAPAIQMGSVDFAWNCSGGLAPTSLEFVFCVAL